LASREDGQPSQGDADFEEFFRRVEPRLRKAFVGWCGPDRAADAVAVALGWAWEHRTDLARIDNPIGYLYRVGQTGVRDRQQGLLERPVPPETPSVEPKLVAAMRALPERQRAAVWLAVACGYTHAETATALGISRSAAGTHVKRGMATLRMALSVDDAERGSYDR
jgi:DNA-directed RNA polymerase specialized sigma24 family protein